MNRNVIFRSLLLWALNFALMIAMFAIIDDKYIFDSSNMLKSSLAAMSPVIYNYIMYRKSKRTQIQKIKELK